MPAKKLFPRRFAIPLGRRFNAMTLQNIGDCRARHGVSQIGQRAVNAAVTPTAILFGHTQNEIRNFGRRRWPSRSSEGAAVVLLGNQFPMPRQQGLGCDDCGYLGEDFPAQLLRLGSKSPPLIIRKAEPSTADLLPQNAIFLDQIVNDLVLSLVQPTRKGNDKKRKCCFIPATLSSKDQLQTELQLPHVDPVARRGDLAERARARDGNTGGVEPIGV